MEWPYRSRMAVEVSEEDGVDISGEAEPVFEWLDGLRIHDLDSIYTLFYKGKTRWDYERHIS